ncbi:uncharacterized protein TRAVEDRAFT_16879 [Trametes versicolor FP-101664 SS1]|uniref:uncharacterized protein n=1 Tax=Trametes versicolor (strain FP-101664) TaxID=717944 RepID=UPI00046214F3|nr:uncharacterized protein TRAVEDRAFT_16879 [Trametes versicolor FP-101664 SS1]EIW64972.1 hypothetical protein TRAVEDRAFT_16879 [Trametes versicolor FP-101664 SS1]
MSPNTIPLNVMARERCRIPVGDPTSLRALQNIHYDIPIMPRIPLYVGLLVRVIPIQPTTPAAGESPDEDPRTAPPTYTAAATSVAGKIIGIRTLERNTVELVVKNDDISTRTAYAYLTVHHAEGKTVHLPLGLRAIRAVSRPFLQKTRDVPIEHDAVITAAPAQFSATGERNGPDEVIPTAEEWIRRRNEQRRL